MVYICIYVSGSPETILWWYYDYLAEIYCKVSTKRGAPTRSIHTLGLGAWKTGLSSWHLDGLGGHGTGGCHLFCQFLIRMTRQIVGQSSNEGIPSSGSVHHLFWWHEGRLDMIEDSWLRFATQNGAQFPQGYDHRVGSQPDELSGGYLGFSAKERQSIEALGCPAGITYSTVSILGTLVMRAASLSFTQKMLANESSSFGVFSIAGAALTMDIPLKAFRAVRVASMGVSSWQTSTLASWNKESAAATSQDLRQLLAPTTMIMLFSPPSETPIWATPVV